MKNYEEPGFELDFSTLPIDLLRTIQNACTSIGIKRLALVGGIVRDVLIQRVHSSKAHLQDIDLLVEGSASKLAEAIESQLSPGQLIEFRVHESYDTVEMNINGVRVDLATARLEVYQAPGENPIVTPSDIEKDLTRRDFNINAMAIELNESKLIDLFSGLDGISNMKIDFLHELSVLDDPTRMIETKKMRL